MLTINPIIQELMERAPEIEVNISIEKSNLVYTISGFYKSGTAKIIESNGELVAHTRYDQIDSIESFSELVDLNYSWWKQSCPETWPNPSNEWVELLLDEKLITKKVEISVNYV